MQTTANSLSFAIYELATRKEVEEALLEEIDRLGREFRPSYGDLERLPYSRAIIYETLRLHPPAILIPRISCEDTQVTRNHANHC